MKNVPLGGTMQFQIRAEIFNAFNTVNYGNPGGTFGAATFGRISTARGHAAGAIGRQALFLTFVHHRSPV